jgi:MFS family permease
VAVSASAERVEGPIRTDIPARLDRLPWSKWHWMVVIGLGVTWILDGLEVTIVGIVAPMLEDPKSGLGAGAGAIGFANSMYLAGACAGALILGYATDKLGRKRLFMFSLLWYLVWTVATAFSWDIWSFTFFRFMTGIGIGGEYAAINSAIDELIPARRRGWTDLAINGTWWVGTAAAAGAGIILLNPQDINPDLGWRVAFGMGAVLAIAVLFVRKNIPESPRYLMTHGKWDEADRVVKQIEETVERQKGPLPPPDEKAVVEIDPSRKVGIGGILQAILTTYPSRSFVGLMLMSSQAFFYNAIFFTYALLLTTFFHVSAASVAYYIFPFAVGNILGPLLLGHFFDSVGRRPMIAFTYTASGIGLLVTGLLFRADALTATQMTVCWSVTFFFASAGASAAYLTVSEIFPIESRALAIAVFYAIGTLAGGFAAPWLFGTLIGTGSRDNVFYGYAFGAALMVLAAIVELVWGVEAARRSLEDIARPLTAVRERISSSAARVARPGVRKQAPGTG